ncbi:MAG: histidine phosphatase family protein [Cellulosilyticaceae bacterium]
MNTTIYLTRHGQTEWNIEKRLQGRGNSPLTADGIARAKELGMRIERLPIDVIYSSPIERALHTANILKGTKQVPILLHDGLMEMSFGDYEGQRTDEVTAQNPQWDIERIMHGDTTMCAPNGETLAEVRARVTAAMDEVIKKHQGQTILIVAHGITLKALMYYFKDQDVNTEVMGQATLTQIDVTAQGEFEVVFKNDDTHFTVKNQKLGW